MVGKETPKGGQALVELALIIPIFLLLIAGAIDLGRLFYAYVAITDASKEGALYGATNPSCQTQADCGNPLNVVWHVQSEAGNLTDANGNPLNPTIACLTPDGGAAAVPSECTPGDTYQVGVSYVFKLITPILGSLFNGRIVLHAQANATVLNATPDPIPGLSVTKTVLDPDTNVYVRTPSVDPKTGQPTDLEFTVGDTVDYQITVRNTGGTALTGVTFNDDAGSDGWPKSTADCQRPKGWLAVGESYRCRYSQVAKKAQTGSTNTVTIGADGIASVQDVAIIDVVASPAHLAVGKDVSVYRNEMPFGFLDNLTVGWSSGAQPTVWYRLRVTNDGGRPATRVSVSDSFGQLPSDCDSLPSTLDPGDSWACFYSRTFDGPGNYGNTATFKSKQTGPVRVDASVKVQTCSAPALVVPNLVEDAEGNVHTVGEARSIWFDAGFLGQFKPSGKDGKDVDRQSLDPFTCRPASSNMSVTPK